MIEQLTKGHSKGALKQMVIVLLMMLIIMLGRIC